MKKFSDIVNDRGFLKDSAKSIVKDCFSNGVEMLLSFAKTENELRVMGSILKNIVGDLVSVRIQEKKELKDAFEKYKDVR